jgi:peptide/nickel transport system substrate-binding protein
MILRKLATGIILGAVVAAIIVASGAGFFDRPAASPDKATESASAQKRGGVLRVFQYDSPASMSIHEEAFNSAQNPMMAVFNNLVLFKQDVPQNRMDTIEPDLAAKWSWNADMTELTFQLREGVSWHDGKPFTADDVVFNWEYVADPDTAAVTSGSYREISRIDKLDSHTVKVSFNAPQPFWSDAFCGNRGMIIPKHLFEP